MRTIFGLFPFTEQAKGAVNQLLQEGFAEADINVVVKTERAKEDLDIEHQRAKVEATDAIGEKQLQGLEALLAGQQPSSLNLLDDVYVAGEFMKIIVKDAANVRSGASSLQRALEELDVETEIAELYAQGIDRGEYLLCLQVRDWREPTVTRVLRENEGEELNAYPR